MLSDISLIFLTTLVSLKTRNSTKHNTSPPIIAPRNHTCDKSPEGRGYTGYFVRKASNAGDATTRHSNSSKSTISVSAGRSPIIDPSTDVNEAF